MAKDNGCKKARRPNGSVKRRRGGPKTGAAPRDMISTLVPTDMGHSYVHQIMDARETLRVLRYGRR